DLIGLDILIHLGKAQVDSRGSAGARNPRKGIDNDIVGLNESAFERRKESKDDARWIASGIRNQFCAGNRPGIEFGKPVDCFRQKMPSDMLMFIELCVKLRR